MRGNNETITFNQRIGVYTLYATHRNGRKQKMSGLIDLSNQRFGKLVVMEYVGESIWKCKCDCGKVFLTDGHSIRRGSTKSCGCLGLKNRIMAIKKHGMTQTRLYKIWVGMRKRCFNPKDTSYKFYGKRGISVCIEWQNDFEQFRIWANENGYSDTLTLDRIDGDKNYCPQNCRWINRKEQSRNRRSNVPITYEGKTQIIDDWRKERGIAYSTLYSRIKRGWSIDKAINTPVRQRH